MKKIILALAVLATLTGCTGLKTQCESPGMADSIGGCSARWV